ncbi:hypothetical protein ACFW1A_07990 [Kitasatospora sp. NPDC058965]|uniref:hypothetical protein n=1 Tax=Kitasatospora sp. NPDC058965 TaxID=3346682 RepID=UPI0036BD7B3E
MPSPLRRLLPATAVGAALLATAACADPGRSVSSSDLCGRARSLQAVTDDQGDRAYAAHLGDWHTLLDLTKNAADGKLAAWGKRIDQQDRNAANYYQPLDHLMVYTCRGNADALNRD